MNLPKQSKLIKNKKWKTLIILDACRVDSFKQMIGDINLNGKFKEVDSEARYTGEWYETHWNRNFNDIILISSSPRPWKKEEFNDNFFKSVPVWKGVERWMTTQKNMEKTLEYQKKYPEKRFLCHTVPPHLPYLGDRGQELLDELGVMGGGPDIYKKVRKYGRENGWSRLKACYNEHLLRSLNRVDNVKEDLKEPIIITADHSEMIGEQNDYGHPPYSDWTKRVPWFEVE